MIHERFDLRPGDVSYITDARFEPKDSNGNRVIRPAMIILPGGAYLYKSEREAEPVAAQYTALGYHTFILQYPTLWKQRHSVITEDIDLNEELPYPAQVIDLFRTVALVREHAQEWSVDPNQIFVLGFSAGGHVCASAAVNWQNEDYLKQAGIREPALSKPNAAVLCYPMLDAELARIRTDVPEQYTLQAKYLYKTIFATEHPTEAMIDEMALIHRVTPETVPVFLWHTQADDTTYCIDSTRFIERLIENKVACEYHLFHTGGHGMSLCTAATAPAGGEILLNNALWPFLADAFLKGLSN